MIIEFKTDKGIIPQNIEGIRIDIPADVMDDTVITGYNLENLSGRDITPPLIKHDSILTLEFKNLEFIYHQVSEEIARVESTKREYLPLLIGQINTISGIHYLEESLKNG